jgi:hypothetical protein
VVQDVAAAASSLQVVPVTLVPVPLAVKLNVTVLPAVVEPLAGAVMLTVGTTESTVKLTTSLPEPAAFVAVTVTECAPWLSPVKDAGEVQAVAAAPSSEQVMAVGLLVVENATEAVVVFRNAPSAGELIVTVGMLATVKDTELLPVLVAWSVAVTMTVWAPAARPV